MLVHPVFTDYNCDKQENYDEATGYEYFIHQLILIEQKMLKLLSIVKSEENAYVYALTHTFMDSVSYVIMKFIHRDENYDYDKLSCDIKNIKHIIGIIERSRLLK